MLSWHQKQIYRLIFLVTRYLHLFCVPCSPCLGNLGTLIFYHLNVNTMEEQKEAAGVESEVLSDEEITSYQMPRDTTSVREPIQTPASPALCMLHSSLRSSVQSENVPRNCADRIENDETRGCSRPFSSLGMADKDISWVSAMESPVAEITPGKGFNTIEKATFFPSRASCFVSSTIAVSFFVLLLTLYLYFVCGRYLPTARHHNALQEKSSFFPDLVL